ncbi:hypothetical protein SAMN05216194_101585 [Stutzerimonas kunmingensis]|nr:hypothetical protein SAMN05216194_101585 [Stutzerimonas kunmingensis]
MRQILSLLRRRKPRHFALLDEQGRCRMLLSSAGRPDGANWVEVEEAPELDWPASSHRLRTRGLSGTGALFRAQKSPVGSYGAFRSSRDWPAGQYSRPRRLSAISLISR